MTIFLDVVGNSTGPQPVEWTSRDAMLYALGVGAGAQDPAAELEYTTENTLGVPQQVLPTFAVVLGFHIPWPKFGEFDRAMTLHGEQGLQVHRPLPVDGRGFVTRSVKAIYDKGSGALVEMSQELTDLDGQPYATTMVSHFVRGEGGFGGPRGPKSDWTLPDRAPDAVVDQPTRIDQGLLYRLSGDRNPLHSDPEFARRGGWDRPILHGLCSYGFVGRAVIGFMGRGDMTRFDVRFSSPVMPGETLTTQMWRDGASVLFRTFVGDRKVLDGGFAQFG